MKTVRNPWLDIPAGDYEKHMASPEVGQHQVLNRLFQDVMEAFRPSSIAVLGCGTGNGFEHIDNSVTGRVVGIDINPEYLVIADERHGDSLKGLELVLMDLAESSDTDLGLFDLVYGALVFEYVDFKAVLPGLSRMVTPGGILAVALQLPSSVSGSVTKTKYTSVTSLSPIMQLVNPEVFGCAARAVGLEEIATKELALQQGKRLFSGTYRKIQAG